MQKNLIAYFSRKGNNYVGGSVVNLPVGNTEVMAKTIQSITKGDLFEIQAAHSYSNDYQKCTEEAQRELRENARPKLTDYIPDMDPYDTVFVGFPNWWGTMPMAVFTFLEEYDFAGKTIVPFCTHEGSGMGRSERDIKKLCPRATVLKGLAMHGTYVSEATDKIIQWLDKEVDLK